MKNILSIIAALGLTAGMAQAEMQVTLTGGWDGNRVPDGQQCTLDGGNGSTPPMRITGIPAGTAMIVAEYNDRSYQPLSRNGGHGTIGYAVSGNSADLPAVPGLTDRNLPRGVQVIKKARGTGGVCVRWVSAALFRRAGEPLYCGSSCGGCRGKYAGTPAPGADRAVLIRVSRIAVK